MSSPSPVARTMAALRDEGYTIGIVQRSIPTRPHPTSIDLFGVCDLEALAADHTLYVQVCRDTDLSEHFRTCLDEPRLLELLRCPQRRFEIWSWAKRPRIWSERRMRAGIGENGGVSFVGISRETPMDVRTAAKASR